MVYNFRGYNNDYCRYHYHYLNFMHFLQKNFINLLFFCCLIVLLSAFYIEYVLGHQPCILCLIERIPYAITILLIIFTHRLKKFKKNLFFLLSLIFLISTVISFYHFGIEKGIFNESLFCSLSEENKDLSKEELLKQLKNMPISCKNVTFKLFDLSLTTYNTFLSFIIFLISMRQYQNYEKNR